MKLVQPDDVIAIYVGPVGSTQVKTLYVTNITPDAERSNVQQVLNLIGAAVEDSQKEWKLTKPAAEQGRGQVN